MMRIVLTAMVCGALVVGCTTTGDDGGTTVVSVEAAECFGPTPPPAMDPASSPWAQTAATSYGSGGIMVSVDLTDPDDQPSYSSTGDIRVWTGTGTAPSTEPTTTPHTIELGRDLADYRWANSILVRTPPGTEEIWVYVRVDLDGGISPPTPLEPRRFNKEWSVDCTGDCEVVSPTGWESLDDLP